LLLREDSIDIIHIIDINLDIIIEWCKIIELFKVRYELIELKNLFSMKLLLSEAKL
jgi:hypothetical protein